MAKYTRRLAMIATATALAVTAAAQAATFVSPAAVVSGNTGAYCMFVNAGTAPVQVTSTVHDTSGLDVSLGNNCPTPPATLDAGAICYAMYQTAFSATVYCRFTSTSSKGRGSLVLRDTTTGALAAVVPATK